MDQPTDRRTDGPMDQRSNGLTDRQTDKPSYRDARMHLKNILADFFSVPTRIC